jgi:hypothetical protein
METFFFFVPNRLVWNNWQKFNGEQEDPGDSTDFVIPRIADGYAVSTGQLADYFGLPLGISSTSHAISVLPFRCYNLIWAEWFRDQNMQNSPSLNKGDGPDAISAYFLRRRGKRHDYFTSCLPWPQKGDSVSVPLGTRANIASDAGGLALSIFDTVNTQQRQIDTSLASAVISANLGAVGTELYADLSTATAATINQLRQAFQVQKLLEKDARGGTRYTEVIKAHFGVTSPDARLQRPEYLGGGSTAINISPVAQTESDGGTTPQGNLAAFGTASIHNHGFTKSFTEHGYVIGLVCVRADLTYQKGLQRHWSRQTRFDFYWPSLAHIGEQAVLAKEIFVDNTPDDEIVFGYQERYAEYRYKPSEVTGLFRSGATGTLDFWHLSQNFGTHPVLDAGFIQEAPLGS